jgi:excisionase family DNA binding protein
MERHAQSAQQVPDSTLSVLVGAIAEQVAAQVKAELLAQLQGPSPVQPMLLNVKNAGVYLGRSEQSIQHLIFERELPVVRVGRRVHLDRRDLDAWIEKNKY